MTKQARKRWNSWGGQRGPGQGAYGHDYKGVWAVKSTYTSLCIPERQQDTIAWGYISGTEGEGPQLSRFFKNEEDTSLH